MTEGSRPHISTGRTWRDLPPSPPTEAPPPPAPLPTTPSRRPRRWPWALGAAVLVAAGVLAGVLIPWPHERAADEVDAAVAALPAEIVPPPPPATDPVPSPSPAPEDPLDELQRRLEELLPGSGDFTFRFDGLVDPGSVPEGGRVVANSLTVGPAGTRQELVVRASDGDARIVAESGEEPALGAGEPIRVRGTEGRLQADGTRLRLEWIEGDDVRMVVEVPLAWGEERLVELAEGLVITP